MWAQREKTVWSKLICFLKSVGLHLHLFSFILFHLTASISLLFSDTLLGGNGSSETYCSTCDESLLTPVKLLCANRFHVLHIISQNFLLIRRHHRNDQRRAGDVEGNKVLYQLHPGADSAAFESGGGEQTDQLRRLSEGELRGNPGALSQQPGEIQHRLLCSQHHVQSSETGEEEEFM